MRTNAELRENRILWYKLSVFIYDLQKFDSDKSSEDWLNSANPLNLVLSEPCFNDVEVQMLRRSRTASSGKTLESLLQ
jgi:hypothetical protein